MARNGFGLFFDHLFNLRPGLADAGFLRRKLAKIKAGRMAINEKALERKLNALVKARGGLSIKLLPFNFAGLPDRMLLLPGGLLRFVEVKTTGKQPSAIQRVVHAKFLSLGFPVLIIDKVEDLAQI